MQPDQLVDILRELDFTAQVPVETLQRLAEAAEVRTLAAGSTLFNEGAQCDELFMLIAGQVALDMAVPGRGNVRILTLADGDVLGWSALLAEGRMTASAIVLRETRAVVVSGERLVKLCESQHTAGYQLMRQMALALSRRLVATRLQLLDLFASEAPDSAEPSEVGP